MKKKSFVFKEVYYNLLLLEKTYEKKGNIRIETPEALYEHKYTMEELYAALRTLPKIQLKRVKTY